MSNCKTYMSNTVKNVLIPLFLDGLFNKFNSKKIVLNSRINCLSNIYTAAINSGCRRIIIHGIHGKMMGNTRVYSFIENGDQHRIGLGRGGRGAGDRPPPQKKTTLPITFLVQVLAAKCTCIL